jgi:hypothetical protein
MALENIFRNRTRLINRDITVFQNGNPSEGVACPMVIGFEVLGVKIHAVELVLEPQLFE